MGAKGKFNPDIIKRICTEIRAGLPNAFAAARCGISEDTFYTWLKEKPEFSEAVKAAQSEFQHEQLTIIREASLPRYDREGRLVRRGSWQAASWLLERKFPQEYGMRWAGELSGKDGKPLVPDAAVKPPIDWSGFTTDDLKSLLKVLTITAAPQASTNGHSNGSNGA